MLEPSEEPRSESQLAALAARPAYSDETPFNLTAEKIHQLKEQCKAATREWWISKFVKIEIPAVLLRGVEATEEEKKEKKMVIGEVVGMSESGFVLGLAGEHQNTVIVDDFVGGENQCWLLRKEGFWNLFLCLEGCVADSAIVY